MASPEEESSAPAPYKTGSGLDLARRMDRMEMRQDTIETEVRSLAQVVARVELNQNHAEEVNKLRFDGLSNALSTIGAKQDQFIARIDGIISGEIETVQTKQGAAVLAAYEKFRDSTLERLEALEDGDSTRSARNQGRGDVLSWGKIAVITVSPIIVAAMAIITFLANH